MRKHKASYIYRLGDETFTIYRLSHYSSEPLKAVAAGLSFNDQGHYSNDFLRQMKRFGLDKEDVRYEFLSDTRRDMCVSLYLRQICSAEHIRIPEDQVPKRVLEFGESQFDSKIRKKEEGGIRVIQNIVGWLGDKIDDPKAAIEFLCEKYKFLIVD